MSRCLGVVVVVVDIEQGYHELCSQAVIGLSLGLPCISYFINFKKFHRQVTQRVTVMAFPCCKRIKVTLSILSKY